MNKQEEYPCAICDTPTTRINYAHEEPSCSELCDSELDERATEDADNNE